MRSLIFISFLFGSISILAGYLRLIVDDKGNIPLNRFRFTGCLGDFLVGMAFGTGDLLSRHISKNAKSALMIYGGIALFCIGFGVGK